MAAPRTLKPVVAILVVVAAILMLLAAGIVHAAEELLDNVGHANVCAPGERGECWVVESAVVERSGLEELVVRSAEGGSGAIRVEAMSEWELPPPAGAPVSLERWGGGDVGYVHDPASGRRYETEDAPGKGGTFGGLLALLLIAAAISAKTFAWLRGY